MATKATAKPATVESVKGAVELLIGHQSDVAALMEKQGAKYDRVVCYMIEDAVSMQDLRETFQTIDGSDWPKKDDGTYIGEVQAAAGIPAKAAIKANKAKKQKAQKAVPAVPASVYAKAFNRFRASVSSKYQFEKTDDGLIPIGDDDGQPVKAEKAQRAPSRRADNRSSETVELSGGPDLWAHALKDICAHAAKMRADGKGKDRQARAVINASAEMLIAAAKDLAFELELDLTAD